MQVLSSATVFGIVFVILGIIFIIYGLTHLGSDDSGTTTIHESKGFILLGPIPIVWGYGWKGWAIAFLIAVIFLLLFLAF